MALPVPSSALAATEPRWISDRVLTLPILTPLSAGLRPFPHRLEASQFAPSSPSPSRYVPSLTALHLPHATVAPVPSPQSLTQRWHPPPSPAALGHGRACRRRTPPHLSAALPQPPPAPTAHRPPTPLLPLTEQEGRHLRVRPILLPSPPLPSSPLLSPRERDRDPEGGRERGRDSGTEGAGRDSA
ncbi:PREDICTED: vegetative cell wall protein gp1-like [Pseudopodoces humilis]|uniref:vegetative cell wall protein gp1-like n=1 Tax=Pseudopodoces humilis TaxID=181119 RepID=UPI0006B7A08C|nr:PREDICTED: vegetative cell wall protein gp1-like [Pseudopodoces humilis]